MDDLSPEILSKLSDADLKALADGNMMGVSDAGLQILSGGSGPKFQFGATDSMLQGATMGFADEIGAAKDYLLGRGGYSENLRDRHVSQQMYERANPVAAFGAELGGAAGASLIPGYGAFNIVRGPALAARVGPTATRALAAGAAGATTGAITGAGTAEEGKRTEGAIRGGVTGAVLGPLVAGTQQLATKGAQVLRDTTAGIPVVGPVLGATAGVMGATRDFQKRAEEKLLQAFKRDNLTPDEIMLARQVLGDKPETIIERAGPNTLGLADVAAKYPGEARRLAGDLAAERMAGQGERIVGDLSQAFRVQGDPAQISSALAAQRAREAAPLYQKAYAEGERIVDPRIAGFMQLPAFQRAYGVARRLAKYDGVELPPDPRKVTQFDLRTLDYVKRGLDDVLYTTKIPAPGGTGRTERAKIVEAQQAFLATLDDLVPSYAQARAAWAGPTVLRQALEDGQNALRMKASEVQAAMSRMTPAEVEQFKIGALAGIRQRIQESGDGRDLVRAVYGSPEKRALLAQLVGPDEFGRLEQQFLREKAIRRTDDTIRGNSRTAERQAGMDDLEGATTLQAIVQQGPIRGTVDYLLRSGTGVAQPTADKLGPMLFATDPAAQQALLKRLSDLDRLMLQRAAGLGAGYGSAAGTAGGLLSD